MNHLRMKHLPLADVKRSHYIVSPCLTKHRVIVITSLPPSFLQSFSSLPGTS